MFCYQCGKEIKPNWKFCMHCGAKLEDEMNSFPHGMRPDFGGIDFEKIKNQSVPEGKTSDFEPAKKAEQTERLFDRKFKEPVSAPAVEKTDLSDIDWDKVADDLNNFDDEPKSAEQPREEKKSSLRPNSQNFLKNFIVKTDNRCLIKNGKMEICTERNGEDTDISRNPRDHIYGIMSIHEKLPRESGDGCYGGNRYVGDVACGLDYITCYALDKNGIYYIKNGRLFYKNESDTRYIGSYPNAFELLYHENTNQIEVRCFESLMQVGWNEHRDECGYMYEACYDVYNVEYKSVFVNAVK